MAPRGCGERPGLQHRSRCAGAAAGGGSDFDVWRAGGNIGNVVYALILQGLFVDGSDGDGRFLQILFTLLRCDDDVFDAACATFICRLLRLCSHRRQKRKGAQRRIQDSKFRFHATLPSSGRRYRHWRSAQFWMHLCHSGVYVSIRMNASYFIFPDVHAQPTGDKYMHYRWNMDIMIRIYHILNM